MKLEIIGEASLYLGDCRELVFPTPIDTVVTDPPYGMDFRSNMRKEKHKKIQNDGGTAMLKWACNLEAQHSKYVFCRWDNLYDVPKPTSFITWVKDGGGMGDLKHEHARATESIVFYKGPRHEFPLLRPNDLVRAEKTKNSLHPTEKPVSLMTQVVAWTLGTVFDPFMGSGSTGIACVKLGQPFIGVEIDEGYFETACRRIEEAYKSPRFVPQKTRDRPEQEGLTL